MNIGIPILYLVIGFLTGIYLWRKRLENGWSRLAIGLPVFFLLIILLTLATLRDTALLFPSIIALACGLMGGAFCTLLPYVQGRRGR